MDANSIALEFLCPICLTLPGDPVFAEDGFVYDRKCIQQVIDQANSNEIASPMTEKPMGITLITSALAEGIIRELARCNGLDEKFVGAWASQNEDTDFGDIIAETKYNAKQGHVGSMAILGKWYLSGEQKGIDYDADEGYRWSKMAADHGDVTGKAYCGYCLIQGFGVEKDWEDGYEHLIEAASEKNGKCFCCVLYCIYTDAQLNIADYKLTA